MIGYTNQTIWLAIGTNDYGLNKWNSTDFGVAYARLLDEVHTQMPSAIVYAQTPITRAVETANGHGSTTADYRNEIINATATRTSFCTLVNGTDILTYPTDYADTVHPSQAGQSKYANYTKTLLGI
jgi:hypothetical protein